MEVTVMCEEKSTSTVILVDMKKRRIRIRKSTLHQLGDPEYIQLLVNPTDRMVAIRAVDRETSKDQTHWIGKKLRNSGSRNCIEIHSLQFMDRLRSIVEGLDFGHSYHISGVVLKKGRMAVYRLDTIRETTDEGGLL